MCNNIDLPQFILGFDFGIKYIGIAVGQTATHTAKPLICLKIQEQKINWSEIDAIIYAWKPAKLIVGIPKNLNNKSQAITIKSLKFYKQLQQRFKLPTYKVNEQFSTWEAKKILKLHHKINLTQQELCNINTQAAVILVTQWLNEHSINF